MILIVSFAKCLWKQFIKAREKDHVLCVGAELYHNTPHDGKFPMGWITAEGYIFKQLINNNNLNDKNLINSWKNIRIFDVKEAINQPANIFSDESLARVWFQKAIVKQNHVLLSTVDMHHDWIDRSFWNIDIPKIKRGEIHRL